MIRVSSTLSDRDDIPDQRKKDHPGHRAQRTHISGVQDSKAMVKPGDDTQTPKLLGRAYKTLSYNSRWVFSSERLLIKSRDRIISQLT